MNLNINRFKAMIYRGLQCRMKKDDRLEASFLEFAICEGFGFENVGSSSLYADGIKDDIQLSVKTRALEPNVLRKKESRDFQSHPNKFLGPKYTMKHNKWTNGIEIVQRRQEIAVKDDQTADAKIVGEQTLLGFLSNVNVSSKRYNTPITYEVIGIHGFNKTKTSYIFSLFWKEYEPLDPSKISWTRENKSVTGYMNIDGVSKKVCERINGNSSREATCYKEYKDLTKYEFSATIKLPIPDPWEFDEDAILAEINLKEKENGSVLFSE